MEDILCTTEMLPCFMVLDRIFRLTYLIKIISFNTLSLEAGGWNNSTNVKYRPHILLLQQD